MIKKLVQNIELYAPKLYANLKSRVEEKKEEWGELYKITIEKYLEDAKVNYVIVNKDKQLNRVEEERYNVYRYYILEEVYADCGENDIVITEYEYIELMLEYEKQENNIVRMWGFEFELQEDGSVSIRKSMLTSDGYAIRITPECANKINIR